jgi:hypothetical protein
VTAPASAARVPAAHPHARAAPLQPRRPRCPTLTRHTPTSERQRQQHPVAPGARVADVRVVPARLHLCVRVRVCGWLCVWLCVCGCVCVCGVGKATVVTCCDHPRAATFQGPARHTLPSGAQATSSATASSSSSSSMRPPSLGTVATQSGRQRHTRAGRRPRSCPAAPAPSPWSARPGSSPTWRLWVQGRRRCVHQACVGPRAASATSVEQHARAHTRGTRSAAARLLT